MSKRSMSVAMMKVEKDFMLKKIGISKNGFKRRVKKLTVSSITGERQPKMSLKKQCEYLRSILSKNDDFLKFVKEKKMEMENVPKEGAACSVDYKGEETWNQKKV